MDRKRTNSKDRKEQGGVEGLTNKYKEKETQKETRTVWKTKRWHGKREWTEGRCEDEKVERERLCVIRRGFISSHSSFPDK
jgi:hypothetical protein